jgi:AcrR family transcriptional regulator
MKLVGLREMKKNRLKQTVEREALRLFAEQGYEATTVEQIAAAAEISTTTFYRYFSSKEHLVLSGAYEEEQGLHFTELPAGLPLADSMRAMLAKLRESGDVGGDRNAMLARFRLINSVPELRAGQQQHTQEGMQGLARMLAEPAGVDPGSLEARVLAALMGGAVAETLHYWVDHDGEPDLLDLLERTLNMIIPTISRLGTTESEF